MCYVGDHGEDIFDDSRERFLHSSPIPTYYQLRVPFVLWASEQYKAAYSDKWDQIVAHQRIPISTNRVTFHTMLNLAGIASPSLSVEASLCAPQFKQTPRMYVNDHNEYRPMDDCGLKDLDVEQFKKHHLQFP